jgi:hypothetical protein
MNVHFFALNKIEFATMNVVINKLVVTCANVLFKSLLINILLFKKCDVMTKNLSQHIFYPWYVFYSQHGFLFMA